MSFETPHLSRRPCVPAHILVLIEEPEAAFKGPPESNGTVELVIAHTLPTANTSTRVLTRCGFRFVGDVVDPDDDPVWRWERGRAETPSP